MDPFVWLFDKILEIIAILTAMGMIMYGLIIPIAFLYCIIESLKPKPVFLGPKQDLYYQQEIDDQPWYTGQNIDGSIWYFEVRDPWE